MNKKSLLGNGILLLATFIWGMAFVAQSSAVAYLSTFAFNGIRCLIGAVTLLLVLVIRYLISKKPIIASKKELIAGIICGIILFFAINSQQFALELGASAGKAGFLTAIYIVIVPLLRVFGKKKVGLEVILGVLIALPGLWFLCGGFSSVTVADLLLLSCAFFFSLHILYIDAKCAEHDSIAVSLVQFFTASVLTLVFMFISEPLPAADAIVKCGIPLLYAGVLSSAVAYTLQIVGQKLSSTPSVAALLMSTESVFAALGGVIILKETHTQKEYLGCALVFLAVIIAQLPIEKLIKGKINQKKAGKSS